MPRKKAEPETPKINITEMTEKYIKLRDLRKRLDEEHKARIAPILAAQEHVESALLALFNELGMDSAKCEAGTAYRSTRTSVTVADMDSFLEFVKKNDAWHMLERRAAKSAVEEYVAASGGDLPPGLNFGSEVTVNIRRA